jgi:rubrerythrin
MSSIYILAQHKSKYPSREVLRKTMEQRYGVVSPELKGLFAFCSEVAESFIINPNQYKAKGEKVANIRLVEGRESYTCTRCSRKHMKESYKFCPNCGATIVWY